MSPNTVLLAITLGNPVVMVIVGTGLIRLGRRLGQPIYLRIGKITCFAAPVFLILGVIELLIANLRH